MNEQPNYYAIVPADVRYSKNLKPNEKLLYGEITALSNSLGYCFASNSYFAELYDVSKQSVSGWVSNLEKQGFITVSIIRNERNQVEQRRIGIKENLNTPIKENLNTPIKENPKGNSTSNINSTSINNINKEEEIFPFKIGEIEVGSIQEYVSKYGRLRMAFERIFLDSGFPNYEALVEEFETSLSGFADFTDDNHLKNSFKKFITYKQKEEKEKNSAQKENDNENSRGKFHPSIISELDNRPKRRFIAGEEL